MCKLVKRDIYVAYFIKMYQGKLFYEYIDHTHRDRQLDGKFKLCMDTFPLKTSVFVIDFFKNYTCKPQNKVHPLYYHFTQVTIFVHIALMHALEITEEDKQVIREYHFYINDDHIHSLAFVQGFFRVFSDSLRERCIRYNQNLIQSENCIVEFKNEWMFQQLTRLHVTNGVQYFQNFTEARDGKGGNDATRECVKTYFTREEFVKR